MKFKALTAAAVALMTTAPLAYAGGADDDNLVINEEIQITTKAAAPAHMAEDVDEVISGWHFRSDETQSLQADDFDNPGMIFVDQGRDAWAAVDGSEGKSCASCHGEPEDMAGVKPV